MPTAGQHREAPGGSWRLGEHDVAGRTLPARLELVDVVERLGETPDRQVLEDVRRRIDLLGFGVHLAGVRGVAPVDAALLRAWAAVDVLLRRVR